MVVSDIHYGSPFFGWDEEDFKHKILKTKKKHKIDKVIFNGDVYDYYYTSQKELELLDMPDWFYNNGIEVKGNHDITNKLAIDKLIYKNSKGQRILIEHGHNADILNGTWFGRIIVKYGIKILKRIIPENIYFNFVKRLDVDEEFNNRKKDRFKYLIYGLTRLRDYDIVILSHTHKQEIVTTKVDGVKKIYANTGTCSLGKFQCVILDTEKLDVSLIKER